jgi:hypothetical protein
VADIAVITPVLPSRADFLGDAAASIERARAGGVNLEWVVTLDGAGEVPEVQATVVRIARRSGVSNARNMALARCTAPLVTTLDADDTLDADGLIAGIETIRDKCGWVGMSRTLVDGTPTAHTVATRREYDCGEFAETWSAPLSFHPNSFVARRELVLGAGGWGGLAVNEDLLLALTMSELSRGLIVPTILTCYRKWPGQVVADPTYAAMKRQSFEFIEQRINILRAEKGRTRIRAPRPGGAFGISP